MQRKTPEMTLIASEATQMETPEEKKARIKAEIKAKKAENRAKRLKMSWEEYGELLRELQKSSSSRKGKPVTRAHLKGSKPHDFIPAGTRRNQRTIESLRRTAERYSNANSRKN